ncbi:MAG: cytochrome c biogenesis protein CcsA, partial [Planctomycetales bacterium]|nr:cytochrome c biogenesis protein CcsA [Planctomycetales bacterium]
MKPSVRNYGMLTGISLVCFSTSYAITLALEVSRLFFRMPIRMVVMLLFAIIGIAMQTLYLYNRATAPGLASVPLSNWHDWYVIAAWVLAAAYIYLAASRPQTSVGLFLLPVVLVLVGVAYAFPKDLSLPQSHALNVWGIAHGVLLLLGTIAVSLGFVAGMMYLVQSYRLKHKLPPRQGFKLPSLEWLQRVNKQLLTLSSCFIGLGIVAGVILNLVKGQGRMSWGDPIVLMSGVLLVWLIVATVFEWTYKPAQQGRKVAYMTVVSFIMLAMVMGLLVMGSTQHTKSGVGSQPAQQTSNVRRGSPDPAETADRRSQDERRRRP